MRWIACVVGSAWIAFASAWCPADEPSGQKKPDRPGLMLKKPSLPEVDPRSGSDHPIDRLLQPYFAEHDVTTNAVVDDRLFARRVHLDLIGLLPTPDQLESFTADSRIDKRQRLVRALLADKRGYSDHWLSFWNDLLRNAYRGTGFIDDGRSQITGWLYGALYHNQPYDRFVRELIDPPPGSGAEGFTKGIVWRGTVNASQRPEMQAAQSLGQVFLGLNLKCASCHDSFINDWKLADAYALASVFADKPLEIHQCDKPTGTISDVGFLYPELGQIAPTATKAERVKRLAELMSSPQNGRLTRTIVNRLWTQLMGRGLIEPVDEMDNPPWHAELLEWLACDFAEHGCDLKHTLEAICTSRAYQLPSVGSSPPNEKKFVFRGPVVKRMSAEQFVDALSTVTGVWTEATPPLFQRDGRGQGGQLAAVATVRSSESPRAPQVDLKAAKWIWSTDQAARAADGGRIFLRKTFALESLPKQALAVVTSDNEFTLFVNGKKVASGNAWDRPVLVNLAPHLKAGANVLAAEAINWPDPVTKKGLDSASPNPAGFILYAVSKDAEQLLWELGTDETWLVSTERSAGWEKPGFATKGWSHAKVAGEVTAAPWNITARLMQTIAAPQESVRAALTMGDELLTALGQPNREQVVTRREPWLTTLQALELTNGSTLEEHLERGAKRWLDAGPQQPSEVVSRLYLAALGRAPTETERSLATELIAPSANSNNVADLLWTLVMLPEFQLIR